MTAFSRPASTAGRLPRLTATLSRLQTSDLGTFSMLRIGRLRLLAAELPWRANIMGISCIPPSCYRCIPRDVESRGAHFEVLDVPARQRILIQAGSWTGDETQGLRADTRGGIIPGLHVSDLAGQMAVIDSRIALNLLIAAAPDGFMLDIADSTAGGRAGRRWALV